MRWRYESKAHRGLTIEIKDRDTEGIYTLMIQRHGAEIYLNEIRYQDLIDLMRGFGVDEHETDTFVLEAHRLPQSNFSNQPINLSTKA